MVQRQRMCPIHNHYIIKDLYYYYKIIINYVKIISINTRITMPSVVVSNSDRVPKSPTSQSSTLKALSGTAQKVKGVAALKALFESRPSVVEQQWVRGQCPAAQSEPLTSRKRSNAFSIKKATPRPEILPPLTEEQSKQEKALRSKLARLPLGQRQELVCGDRVYVHKTLQWARAQQKLAQQARQAVFDVMAAEDHPSAPDIRKLDAAFQKWRKLETVDQEIAQLCCALIVAQCKNRPLPSRPS